MIERDDIDQRFRANLDRVRSLLSFFENASEGGAGRKPVPIADLLRAAVVLLHATLEDLLRSLAEWKLPLAPAQSLEGIPLASGKKATFNLMELAQFRGQTVDSVIALSVLNHLERSSYSHPGKSAEILGKLGIPVKLTPKLKKGLSMLISRRHSIAHRADRNPFFGRGHQMTRTISLTFVLKWRKAVEDLGNAILKTV